MHKRKSFLAVAGPLLLVSLAGGALAASGTADPSQLGPDSLRQVATLSGRVTALTRLGNTLLAGAGGMVYSIDLATHRVLGQKVVDGVPMESLQLYRGRALADTNYGIYSLDAKDPRKLRSYYLTSEARLRRTVIVDDYALQPSGGWVNLIRLINGGGPGLRGDYYGFINPVAIDAIGATAYIGTMGGDLFVLDFTNPEQPQPLGHITSTQRINALAARWSEVYLFGHGGGYYDSGFSDSGGELTICDARDPTAPQVVTQLVLPRPDQIAQSLWAPNQLLIVDGYAYIFTPNAGLAIVDVRQARAPRVVQAFDQHTLAYAALRFGDRLYVARSDADLEVLDIRDPEHPYTIERIRFPNRGQTLRLAPAGNRMYVAAGSDAIVWVRPSSPGIVESPEVPEYELRIVNVSDPLSPSVLGSVVLGTTVPGTIHVVGDRVVVLVGSELETVDVSDPTQSKVVSRLNLPGSPTRLELLGSLGLVSDGSDRLLLVDLASLDDPSILRWAKLPSAAADLGVVNGLVYLFSPPEGDPFHQPWRTTLYLLSINADGLVATVAERPFLMNIGSTRQTSAVLDHYIYFGSSSLHIFDVSVPKAPRMAFQQEGAFGLFGGRVVSAHDDTLLLAPTSDNGCMMAVFDISDRVQPRYIGLQNTSYATCSRDAVAVGRYVYIANSYDGLTVNLPLLPGTPTPTPRSDPTEWPPPTPAPTENPTPTAVPTPPPIFVPQVSAG